MCSQPVPAPVAWFVPFQQVFRACRSLCWSKPTTSINLAATAAGLALHPSQQALQEFDAVAEPYRAIHALLDATQPGHTV
jgi:hypothetical protein